MAFRAASTVITLEAEKLVDLQEILMDGDKEAAFAFLQDVIGEKIRCAQDESHRPEFEGGIRPERGRHRPPSAAHDDSGETG